MTKNQTQTKQQCFFSLNKKRLLLFVLFCFVFVLAFCATENVSVAEGKEWFKIMTDEERAKEIEEATGGGGILVSAGKDMLEAGLKLLLKVAAWTLATAVETLNFMLDGRIYEEVFFSKASRQAINTGWGLVRDFVNMFYVLILLFLAIATILRVNRFSDKKLLFTVVLSALLINFSQPITIVVVDASNLAMNFFAKQITSAGASFGTVLAKKVNLANAGVGNVFGTQGAYIATFAEIIFTAVLAITIFVLAISLIIRLVAFWVLIVLSPLAFFGLTLPGTALSSLWSGWLSKLTNYAFFGPILLFFLWLSLILISALSSSKMASTIPGINDPIAAGKGIETTIINILKETIPFVAAIYMLFYGYSLSRDMAAKAGSLAGSLFNKGQGWMNKGAKYAAIAGTGGVGLMAYGTYKGAQAGGKIIGKNIKGAAQAYGTGLMKRAGFDTAEDKKRKNEERQARAAGGDTLKEFNRKKASEIEKEWKDKGYPDSKEEERIDKSGSDAERMALAFRRANNGDLNTVAKVEAAMKAMKGDATSINKLKSAGNKKNFDAFTDYEIANNKEAVIQKQIDAINKEREMNGEGKMSEATERAKRAGLNSNDKYLKDLIYRSYLKRASQKEIAEQDVNFHGHEEHIRYQQERIANAVDPSKIKEENRKRADNEFNSEKYRRWKDAGLLG